MGVNNETGAVQDIGALVQRVRAARNGKRIHFHCDAVQVLGKTELNLQGWDIDSASFSAHKIGGPRGIGLLYTRKPIEGIYSGGGQERGMRAGTENLFGALSFAAALEKCGQPETVLADSQVAARRWSRLIDAFRSIEGCRLIPGDRRADDDRFSPYILQAAFKDIPAETFVRAMDDLGFSLSTGSACSSHSKKRPVLAAMGVDEKTAFEAVRFSQGRLTTEDDVEELIAGVRECLRSLK
jgi:cysteine desulfurase